VTPDLTVPDPSDPAFPVAVAGRLYGPVPLTRLRADAASGALSARAIFWDGRGWLPVAALRAGDAPAVAPPAAPGTRADGVPPAGTITAERGADAGGAADGEAGATAAREWGADTAPRDRWEPPPREWDRLTQDGGGAGAGAGVDGGGAPTGGMTLAEAAWEPQPQALPANRWPLMDRRERYLVLYGELLMLEGGSPTFGELLGTRALTEELPVSDIVSVTLTPDGDAVRLEASTFHGMYEPLALIARLSPTDAQAAKRELEAEGVRVREIEGADANGTGAPMVRK